MNKKPSRNIQVFIRQLNRPIFTTRELCVFSGKSASAVTQALNNLKKQGLVLKAYRGIWIEAGNNRVSPFGLVQYLLPGHKAYVSFMSALHLYGIIEQIPQIITVASTSHTREIRTKLGVFSVHQIAPAYFCGFDWYKGEGEFLIAEPEKALIDCLYLSSRKKRQFAYFPELHLPAAFSFRKAEKWIKNIPDPKIRANVRKKLKAISNDSRPG